MVSFTVKLEVMNRMGAQRNENFREWYKIKKRNTNPVKTSDFKTSSLFENVGDITSTC